MPPSSKELANESSQATCQKSLYIRFSAHWCSSNLVSDLLSESSDFGDDHRLHALGRIFGFEAKVERLGDEIMIFSQASFESEEMETYRRTDRLICRVVPHRKAI